MFLSIVFRFTFLPVLAVQRRMDLPDFFLMHGSCRHSWHGFSSGLCGPLTESGLAQGQMLLEFHLLKVVACLAFLQLWAQPRKVSAGLAPGCSPPCPSSPGIQSKHLGPVLAQPGTCCQTS